ncbi:M20/M25/M40 family metallo-hydrolase [Ornithinicoccus hortensis]|uniref:M20/M25/M40 family metallo-hydrolase n=1 Tax=Ornithinicoccus hortensis TaxID=82346 RepID=UPI001B85D4F5|nr:M20/M25/M40 family metallo-hydrolase [Ornithinicoccus hortensis]
MSSSSSASAPSPSTPPPRHRRGHPSAHGATAEVTYTREFASTVNHADATALAIRVAQHAVGEDQHEPATPPIMASEDFGLYAAHTPTNFTFIGNGTTGQPGGTPLHSHDYTFNDAILADGIRYYQELVHQTLARPAD